MKDLNYYLNLPYEIIVRPLDEGGGYYAYYRDFPGIMGDGESYAEAIEDVKKAFAFVIETDLKEGLSIKEPTDPLNDPSVRINITMPKSVLEAIDRVSKNRSKYLTTLVRADLALA
ncbi:type II toxin-antitoxin system HicB family antitoxin [Campylobacter sp. 19-13652]|uniref:type II toxin-antitoxin system HicB family antitoxin n=1 Tax=Campylobacter sp. 19-13652 TaxID=2840180 RepID=UPI001C740CD6|nr:type II toxin-antitoxin system HicB family antitoxin [Campylobacter sp. 19-13652]BCX79956.1 hypothetical protein LBC_14180 [Campylobacter sp. 19-13652]